MSSVRLILGDCLKAMIDMPDGTFDAVITDPPYSSGGQFRGDRNQATSTKYVQTDSLDTCRNEFSGDNRDQRSFLLWCTLWMTEAHRITKPGGIIVCFTDWRQLPTMTDAIQCGGWVWRNMGTWWKPGVRMQRGRFSSSSEYVVYGSRGVPSEGERSPQNVFSCAPVGGEEKEHIAEKPEAVMDWILGLVPNGGMVLDPFMGSGTTGVSCVRNRLPFVGVEMDSGSFSTAERRIAEAQSTLWTAPTPKVPDKQLFEVPA